MLGNIFAAIIGALFTLLIRELYDALKEQSKVVKSTIFLKFMKITEDEKKYLSLKYFVLIVRHGKDNIKESGHLLNKTINFKGENPKCATIRFHRILGTQFKCFVDYTEQQQYENIETFLKNNGFKNIVHDDERTKNRIWFIHPDYPVTQSLDGYINNYKQAIELERNTNNIRKFINYLIKICKNLFYKSKKYYSQILSI